MARDEVSANHIASQNLVILPLTIMKDPLLKKSSLTHINLFKMVNSLVLLGLGHCFIIKALIMHINS
jgi:hypothetical protein